MKLQTPHSLRTEHEELHAELAGATKLKGKIGEAARAVAEVLHPHFAKEEEFAMPPLGALSMVSQGKITPDMRELLTMTDRLRRSSARCLKNTTIVAAAKKLTRVALKEKRMEYAHFSEKLILHAKTEEDVLYPASILIGEYLSLKLNK